MTINDNFSVHLFLHIFVWIQHFWDPPLNRLIPETIIKKTSYKAVTVYFLFILSRRKDIETWVQLFKTKDVVS